MWVAFGFEVQKCRSLTQICRPPPICRRLPPWGPLRPHRPRPRSAAPGAGRRLWPRPDPTAPRGFQQSFCTKNWFCECFGPFGWWFMSWDACGDSCTPLMINDDACTIQLPWNPTIADLSTFLSSISAVFASGFGIVSEKITCWGHRYWSVWKYLKFKHAFRKWAKHALSPFDITPYTARVRVEIATDTFAIYSL